MKITVTEEELAGTRAARRGVQPLKSGQGVKFQKTITINLPVAEVYSFWSDLENLPKFMMHLQSVSQKSPGLSHWVIKPQEKSTLEWDAEILENRTNELISWQSLPGSDVDNAGSVWFRPAIGNRGTVVKVAIKYNPPGGKFAARVSKLLGKDPNGVIEDDLYRLKSLLETGEIPTTAGIAAMADRLLPSANSGSGETKAGHQSESAWSPSFLTGPDRRRGAPEQ